MGRSSLHLFSRYSCLIFTDLSKCSSEEGELSFQDALLGREKHWALRVWDARGMDSAEVFAGEGGQANLGDVNIHSCSLPERMAG